MNVKEMKKFLESFDGDLDVHFFLHTERAVDRIIPCEPWTTGLGPVFNFQPKFEAKHDAERLPDLVRDAHTAEDDERSVFGG